MSAIHIFSHPNLSYYILLLHGHANWDFGMRNCLQIKFRLSRDFVEFLQVNFATSTQPFASILRWWFSITHCLQIFAIFRTQRVCFYIHFSGRSLSYFVSSLVTLNLKSRVLAHCYLLDICTMNISHKSQLTVFADSDSCNQWRIATCFIILLSLTQGN